MSSVQRKGFSLRFLVKICLVLRLFLAAAAAQPAQPVIEPRIVSGPGGGCIAGAVELPADGPGYQTVRASRSWFWGHPDTVSALRMLALRAKAVGLPTLYMNDLSRPHGGPMPGLHASHQVGLDADVWLDLSPKPALSPAARDALEVASIVAGRGRLAGDRPHPGEPGHQAAALPHPPGGPRLAAADPPVVRPRRPHAPAFPLPGGPA